MNEHVEACSRESSVSVRRERFDWEGLWDGRPSLSYPRDTCTVSISRRIWWHPNNVSNPIHKAYNMMFKVAITPRSKAHEGLILCPYKFVADSQIQVLLQSKEP